MCSRLVAAITLVVFVSGCNSLSFDSFPTLDSRSVSSPKLGENTRWRLRLDVGQELGTWMPKRYPGWAESGARLGVDVDVEFVAAPCDESEELVGPAQNTCVLRVVSVPSTFVSDQGEQTVRFIGGGWCVQRPTSDIRNAEGGVIRPEGLLRFWIECTSGAQRQDVEIKRNTRIFFTTGVWDDPEGMKNFKSEYDRTMVEMMDITDATRRLKTREDSNIWQKITDYRTMVSNSQAYDRLEARKVELEKTAAPLNSPQVGNGVQIAPTGSLVIQGNEGFLGTSEYLIFGTFSSKAL